MLVLVYVDDIILTGSDPSLLAALTSHLKSRFAVKDLGPSTHFLGVEVARCCDGLFLSQHKYTDDLLHRHGIVGAKGVSTPMATSSLLPVSGEVNPSDYRSAIGGLQYLTLTRPNILFTVNRLAKAMSSPTFDDWIAVKRLFRYLKGSLHHGLLLRKASVLISHGIF